jgi:hypothetical protein
MPRLNEDQRNNAIGRLQAGETQKAWLVTINDPAFKTHNKIILSSHNDI